ncbi:MAG: DUF2934 domain-containing protein [Rhodothermales bacterium]|nr:DUF2934 domain-containing protein [Rhodothermales bacterium]
MNNDLLVNTTVNPPSEVPGTELLSEESHTDPGPDADDSFGYRDWNNAEDRYEMIAEAAYYKAEQRGFEIGNDELDWLEAEQELILQMGSDPVD